MATQGEASLGRSCAEKGATFDYPCLDGGGSEGQYFGASVSICSPRSERRVQGLSLRISNVPQRVTCRYPDQPWLAEDDDTDAANDCWFDRSVTQAMTNLSRINSARRHVRRVVQHPGFDAVLATIIVGNSVCIAKEQEFALANVDAPILHALEQAFLSIYVLEIFVRLLAGGLTAFRDAWVLFDMAIVSVSVLTQWVLPVNQFGEMRALVLIRMARLARLARCARLIAIFRELWLLVHGLMTSVGVLIWSALLTGSLIFFFSLVGLEVITIRYATNGSFDPDVEGVVEEYFSSLGTTMLTLTQFVTLDSIAAIYRPLVRHDPVLAIYFGILVLAVAILLINLVTAVLVDGALEQADQNREALQQSKSKRKKKALKELHDLFVKLDSDGSGKVELEELLHSDNEQMETFRGMIKEEDLKEVFNALDLDSDGALDVDEFCEGMYEAGVLGRPLDFKRIDKWFDTVLRAMVHMQAREADLADTISRMDQQLVKLLPQPVLAPKMDVIDHAVDKVDDAPRATMEAVCASHSITVESSGQAVAPLAAAVAPKNDESKDAGELCDKNGIEAETDAVECGDTLFDVLDENVRRPDSCRAACAWQGSGSDVNWF